MHTLEIRAIGSLQEPWQKEAVDMYVKRLTSLEKLRVQECPEGGSSGSPDPERILERERDALLKGIRDTSVVVALDRGGVQISSDALSAQFDAWSENGQKPIVFVIGGSWGLHADVLSRAHATLSFGKLTVTHALARIILLEQIYRAGMIREGRAYHK